MNHDHSTDCKHGELKYCIKCDAAYCLCGKQWNQGNVTIPGSLGDFLPPLNGNWENHMVPCVSPGLQPLMQPTIKPFVILT